MAKQVCHSAGVIDLALVSPTLAAWSRWNKLGHHGSDHYPCTIMIKKHRVWGHIQKRPLFQYDTNGHDIVSKIRRKK